jgi:hypothetical protein
MFVDGAKKFRAARRVAPHVERRAVTVLHPHKRAVPDKVGKPIRLRAEP